MPSLMYGETKPIVGVSVAKGFFIGPVGRGHDIAQVHLTASQKREDQEAFARLFVAAPDLLAACEAVMEFLSNGTPVHPGSLVQAEVFNAIRKAKGERRHRLKISADSGD